MVSESMFMLEMVQLLRPKFNAYWLPFLTAPYWLVWLLSFSIPVDFDLFNAVWNRPIKFDSGKAERELGLKFTPMKTTANDMAASLIGLKIVPDRLASASKRD